MRFVKENGMVRAYGWRATISGVMSFFRGNGTNVIKARTLWAGDPGCAASLAVLISVIFAAQTFDAFQMAIWFFFCCLSISLPSRPPSSLVTLFFLR